MKKARLTLALLLPLGAFSLAAISSRAVEVKADEDDVVVYDYTTANSRHNDKNASGLFNVCRSLMSSGSAGSYAALWETYKKAYVKPNGKMMDYYSNVSSFTPGSDQAGQYSKEGDAYNREHSIPKSWWGGAESNQGADPYIVVPTDGYINNMRSNYPFGVVGSVSKSSKNDFSLLGSGSSTYGYSGTVFEPNDIYKGDFARIFFYAVTKYTGAYGWTTGDGSKCFSGSESTNFGITAYAKKLFTDWNNLDPVDEWERSVNDKVSTVQGNRNVFVDHPEYITTIWGGSYDHDTDHYLSLDKTSKAVKVGDAFTLKASSDQDVTLSWYPDDYTVLSLSKSSGKVSDSVTVTALSEGEATVTAKATINEVNYYATCKVTVSAEGESPSTSSSSSSSSPSGDGYWRVYDASSLAPGDEIYIAAPGNSKVAGGLSSTYLSPLDATFSQDGDQLTAIPSGAKGFTLGKNGNYWTLTDENDDKLAATAAKSLSLSSGTSTWNISIDGEGKAQISSSNSNYGTIRYNVTSPRFTTYAGSTANASLVLPSIYRYGEAQGPVDTSEASSEESSQISSSEESSEIISSEESSEIASSEEISSNEESSSVSSSEQSSEQATTEESSEVVSSKEVSSSDVASSEEIQSESSVPEETSEDGPELTSETPSLEPSSEEVETSIDLTDEEYRLANQYAREFLGAFTCDPTGVNAPTFTKQWRELEASFEELPYRVQSYYHYGTASREGDRIERCLARYDYVIDKYGYDDFMGRDHGNGLGHVYGNKARGDNSIWLYFGVGASVVFIGCAIVFLALKKKKRTLDK